MKKKRKNRASPKRRRRTMNSDSLALPSLVDKKRHKRTSPSGALLGGRKGGSRAKRRSYCGTYALQCLTHHLHFIYGASSLDSFINEANWIRSLRTVWRLTYVFTESPCVGVLVARFGTWRGSTAQCRRLARSAKNQFVRGFVRTWQILSSCALSLPPSPCPSPCPPPLTRLRSGRRCCVCSLNL